MKRRDFLKVSIATTLNLIFPYSNTKAIPLFGSEHLKELTFSSVYPRPFYEKSYFTWIVLGASIVAAGVVSYLTAGAGAPAAATGVSTVASWIGGGGAGSYMAGLSTVGSWFGGNAMLGAAILNGISIGTLGTASGKTALTLAARAANLVDMTLTGISFLKKEEDNKGVYVFNIRLPKDLGSGTVRKLVNRIYELEEDKQDALEKKDFKKAENIDQELYRLYKYGNSLLEKEFIKEKPSQENLLVLGIIAYKLGNIDNFAIALELIRENYKPKKDSFLKYLEGINVLSTPEIYNSNKALNLFIDSYRQENYTIEPLIAIISLLGDNYQLNKEKISLFVKLGEENYNPDKYIGRPLIALYSRAANIAFNNQDWESALKYYSKEYDELGIIIKILPIAKDLKNHIKIQMAICYKHLGNLNKAQNLKEEVLENCDTENCKKQFEKLFKES